MKPIHVIMDVDPGVDDIFALTLAATHPKIDLMGVTTTFGNRQLCRTNRNALAFLELIGYGHIPVGKGSEVPIKRDLLPYEDEGEYVVHGAEGFGYAPVPPYTKTNVELVAEDLIAKLVQECDEKVTLVPVGPLANIAKFIVKYPNLLSKIEKISLMGGAVEGGNISPYAEVNIFLDPEAAKVVFDSGIPIVMCGLDGTWAGYIKREEWEPVLTGEEPLRKWLYQALDYYSEFYEKDHPGVVLHDSLAVAYLIDPTIVKTKPARVQIDVSGGDHYGQTVADFEQTDDCKFNTLVAMGADRDAFLQLFQESIQALF